MTKKLKKVISMFVIFTFLLILNNWAVEANTISENEQNGAITTANAIIINDNITGTLSDSYDEDYFTFTLKTCGNLEVNFNHDKIAGVTDVLWDISIMNESQKELQTLNSKGNEDKKTALIGLPVGTYYIKIVHHGWDNTYSNIPYILSIKLNESDYFEKEFNNNIDEPNTLELNRPYIGQVSNSYDEDFYSFTTTENGNIDMKFNHIKLPGITEKLWEAYITNEAGKVYQFLYSNGNEEKESNSIGLPAGTYFIRVKHSDYCNQAYLNTPYELTVNFTKSEYYEKEFNNNIDEPNMLELNKTYVGLLNSSDDEDFFSFVTKKNGNIELKFKHKKLLGVTETFWEIYIINQDGDTYQYIYSNGNEDNKSGKIGLPAGTYYIRVKHKDWCNSGYANVPYQLSVNFVQSELYEKEFNNNSDEPNLLTLGKQYIGQLSSREDDDFYSFYLSKKGNIELRLYHDKLPGISETLWQLNLTNKSGKNIKTISSNGNTDKKSLLIKNLPAGVYYLQIKHKDWCSDKYIDINYYVSVISRK